MMIASRPENIEELVELEEYMNSVISLLLPPLQLCIADMLSYHNLLDAFNYKIDAEHFSLLWTVVGYPEKVKKRCLEASEQNNYVKRRFNDDMMGEQEDFLKELEDLETSIRSLEEYTNLDDVEEIALVVAGVNARMGLAMEKATKFNTREGLFNADLTNYEDLGRLSKMLDPFVNLWVTTKEWLELKVAWQASLFQELNAEEIESKMDGFTTAILKAAKYFTKVDMAEQLIVANLIKLEILDFSPDVPLIIALRNPGMRDRHWNEIAAHLNLESFSVEDMTTSYVLSLGLKDHFDVVMKIGESAAKEYQIEHALDKMEREWENFHLGMLP